MSTNASHVYSVFNFYLTQMMRLKYEKHYQMNRLFSIKFFVDPKKRENYS